MVVTSGYGSPMESTSSGAHPNDVPSAFVPDIMAGRVVFVTGGGTGIGKEIARVFGRHGAHVAIASRRREVLDETQAELASEGIECHVDEFDVRDAAAARRVVDGVIERFGRLDVVVNNAAGNFPAPITSISPNGFKAVVDIDLLGTYNVSRAAFDAWLGEHGGNVVNISAPFELRGVSMQAHVAAAKAGVDSLTRTCAVEWGPYGVRVNAVAPGSIGGTEGVRRFADAVRGGDDTPTNPVGLMGHGADIAYCVMFLCTESARFISGQVIAVDGAGSADMLRLGRSVR
jgi:peroxisomal 2,4-dienoyl-CoA reductase